MAPPPVPSLSAVTPRLLAAASRLFAVEGRKRLRTLNWTDGQEVMSRRKRFAGIAGRHRAVFSPSDLLNINMKEKLTVKREKKTLSIFIFQHLDSDQRSSSHRCPENRTHLLPSSRPALVS